MVEIQAPPSQGFMHARMYDCFLGIEDIVGLSEIGSLPKTPIPTQAPQSSAQPPTRHASPEISSPLRLPKHDQMLHMNLRRGKRSASLGGR
jgi:hypothetical protein